MILQRIPESDFHAAAAAVRMSERNRQLAKAVLVEGEKAVTVAQRHGITRQQVQRAAMRIYTAHLRRAIGDPSWQQVTVRVPPRLAEQIREIERRAWAHYRQRATGANTEESG
jgi:hypothetical protein